METEHFEVETLDGERYILNEMCDNIDYSDRIYVVFKNGDDVLALLPHRVIGCIYKTNRRTKGNDKN